MHLGLLIVKETCAETTLILYHRIRICFGKLSRFTARVLLILLSQAIFERVGLIVSAIASFTGCVRSDDHTKLIIVIIFVVRNPNLERFL